MIKKGQRYPLFPDSVSLRDQVHYFVTFRPGTPLNMDVSRFRKIKHLSVMLKTQAAKGAKDLSSKTLSYKVPTGLG